MANEIKLEVYTFRIKEINKEKKEENYEQLNSIGGLDFYDIFSKYLKFLDTLDVDDVLKKAIQLKSASLHFAKGKRQIRGIFESGGFGIESDIYNLKSNKHKITKAEDDVEIMPFYFLFHIPDNRNIGICIIERIGIYGISTILKNSLSKFLRDTTNYIIEFSPLISKDLAKAFVNDGGVKEIILRRYALPNDKADILTMKEYREQILSVELRIKAKGIFQGFNKRINKYLLSPNAKFFDVKQLREIGFDDSSLISVKSELDGTTRTVDLSQTMQIRPYYLIDEKVKKTKGHPTFGSIDAEANELLNTLIKEV